MSDKTYTIRCADVAVTVDMRDRVNLRIETQFDGERWRKSTNDDGEVVQRCENPPLTLLIPWRHLREHMPAEIEDLPDGHQ